VRRRTHCGTPGPRKRTTPSCHDGDETATARYPQAPTDHIFSKATYLDDPDGLGNLIDGSLSPSYARSFGVKTPKITELLQAGRAEFDPAKRKAIYRTVEEVAIAEAPLVGLAWRSQGYAMQKRVGGFKNLPGALSFYSGTTFEDASAG